MIRVLLSLDLKKSENKRDEFYEFLKNINWQKTNDVDTVWTLTYPKLEADDSKSYTKIKNNIKLRLIEASTNLKLSRIEYVAQLGNSEVIARAIKKDEGEYKQFKRKLYRED